MLAIGVLLVVLPSAAYEGFSYLLWLNEGSNFSHPVVIVDAKVPRTWKSLRFVVEPSSSLELAQGPSDRRLNAATAAVGDPQNQIEAERTCAIARNDPANQALQPKPRQVEWAVNQAVTGSLNTVRTMLATTLEWVQRAGPSLLLTARSQIGFQGSSRSSTLAIWTTAKPQFSTIKRGPHAVAPF